MPTARLEPTQILVKHCCANRSKNYKCALLSGEDRNTNMPSIQFPIIKSKLLFSKEPYYVFVYFLIKNWTIYFSSSLMCKVARNSLGMHGFPQPTPFLLLLFCLCCVFDGFIQNQKRTEKREPELSRTPYKMSQQKNGEKGEESHD